MRVPTGLKRSKSDSGYRTAEIELAASRNPARPVLADPYLDAEAGRLVATDSYVLVALPVELDDGDTSGWVPAEAIKAARKIQFGNASIELAGDTAVVQADGRRTEFSRANDRGEFPEWVSLVPPDSRPKLVFSVNAEKLLQAAKALGAPEVTIEVSESDSDPLVVRPNRATDGRFALVMPIRLVRSR